MAYDGKIGYQWAHFRLTLVVQTVRFVFKRSFRRSFRRKLRWWSGRLPNNDEQPQLRFCLFLLLSICFFGAIVFAVFSLSFHRSTQSIQRLAVRYRATCHQQAVGRFSCRWQCPALSSLARFSAQPNASLVAPTQLFSRRKFVFLDKNFGVFLPLLRLPSFAFFSDNTFSTSLPKQHSFRRTTLKNSKKTRFFLPFSISLKQIFWPPLARFHSF